jgi:hypothetical protein
MKRLCTLLALALLAANASAQNTVVKNGILTGANNQVPSGSTLTIKSGGTFTIEGGGSITGVQATDATLTALAGQTTAANKLTYWDGVDDANTIDFSPVSQTFLGYTTAAAWRNAIFPASGAEGDIITHDGTNWIRQAIGTAGQVLTVQGDGTFAWNTFAPTIAADDVSFDNTTSGLTATDVQAAIDELDSAIATKANGPSSSTDNALARFDSTTGKLLQNSTTTLSDAGEFAFADGVRQSFNPDATNAGLNVGSQAGDPSSPSNGDLWYDSIANELTAHINGSNVALGAGGGGGGGTALFVGRSAKTSAYTVVSGDKGYLIDCTSGTFIVSLTAAATLGDGFFVAVYNSGTGSITLDPAGSETIKEGGASASTKVLAEGSGVILFCDGTKWLIVASSLHFYSSSSSTVETDRRLLANNTTNSTVRSAGSLYVAGSAGVNGYLNVGNRLDVADATAATTTTTGSGIFAGGVGIGGALLTGRSVVVQTSDVAINANRSWSVYTNTGDTAQVVLTLPSAAAGIELTFIVQDGDGIRITAASGDTIRIAGTVTAAAGYVESTTIGNTVTLVAINATEWMATAVNGTWTFGP